MRILIVILLICTANLNAQQGSFTFEDSSFTVGSILRIEDDLTVSTDHPLVGEDTFYEDNKSFFNPILRFLHDHPEITLEIGSHTDARGSEKSNLKLSQKEAERIMRTLIAHGVEPSRIIAKGYGESYSLVPEEKTEMLSGEEQENAHAMNRRIELKILSINLESK